MKRIKETIALYRIYRRSERRQHMNTEETTPPAVVLSTALLDAAAPKRDRQTTEPGGCECHHCGCIFIGGPEHTACAECHAAFTAAMHEDYLRAEHQAEMRRDAFGV